MSEKSPEANGDASDALSAQLEALKKYQANPTEANEKELEESNRVLHDLEETRAKLLEDESGIEAPFDLGSPEDRET